MKKSFVLTLLSSIIILKSTSAQLSPSQKMFYDPFALNFVMYESATPCEEKVLGHYAAVYHRYYNLASITFTSNFFARITTKAHALGFPEIAFSGPSIINGVSNFIAEKWIRYGEEKGLTGLEVAGIYRYYLHTGELCEVVGENYKDYHAVRKFVYQKIDEFSANRPVREGN